MFTRTGSCSALLSSERDFRQRSPTHSCKTEHMQKGTILFSFKNILGKDTKQEKNYRYVFYSVFLFILSFTVQGGWGVIYQLIFSPADRSSSKRILHTHPNWLFLWRHFPLQKCHPGQKCVKALSLLAQHPLKNHIKFNISSTQIAHFQSHTRHKSDWN